MVLGGSQLRHCAFGAGRGRLGVRAARSPRWASRSCPRCASCWVWCLLFQRRRRASLSAAARRAGRAAGENGAMALRSSPTTPSPHDPGATAPGGSGRQSARRRRPSPSGARGSWPATWATPSTAGNVTVLKLDATPNRSSSSRRCHLRHAPGTYALRFDGVGRRIGFVVRQTGGTVTRIVERVDRGELAEGKRGSDGDRCTPSVGCRPGLQQGAAPTGARPRPARGDPADGRPPGRSWWDVAVMVQAAAPSAPSASAVRGWPTSGA
ncbi:hypothetical protein QJS66_04710 [Kocuria rhizophila]|nr:hypothetical protein QJS66_04710 [Kocuria rhizophila]